VRHSKEDASSAAGRQRSKGSTRWSIRMQFVPKGMSRVERGGKALGIEALASPSDRRSAAALLSVRAQRPSRMTRRRNSIWHSRTLGRRWRKATKIWSGH